MTIRIGIDIGGVITKYPETFALLWQALDASPGVEVHVITDMPVDKARDMLTRNGFGVREGRLHSCDYDAHGEGCKAVKASEIGLDVLIDDFVGYVAIQGAPPLRLLVMPDASLPYYADAWKTDGREGAFGRSRLRK